MRRSLVTHRVRIVKSLDSSVFSMCRQHGALEAWLSVDGQRLDELQTDVGYSATVTLASPLVRDALLVRRIVRDARLGRTETRDRLRLAPSLEALVDRELR